MNFQNFTSHEITNSFLAFILALFIAGLFFRFLKRNSNKLINLLPNIAVSVGILGTFTGIYIGLLEFDVSDINTSIPNLLDGLKTAFITSIAGMSASIILRLIYEIISTYEEGKTQTDSDDPLDLLKAMVQGITRLENSSQEIEKTIVSCFRSEEEFSLISQLKLIRQEITDSRKEINESFKSFADHIAKSSTDTLVKALGHVIAEFNVLLNELVSESFKELSAAMIKLTEWQEKYRLHMDNMQNKIDVLLKNIEQTSGIIKYSANNFREINEHIGNIDKSISKLKISTEDIESHVDNLNKQNELLKTSLESVKHIGNEAKSVIPTISQRLNELSVKIDKSVSNFIQNIDKTNSTISKFVESSTSEIQNMTQKQLEVLQKSIIDIDEGLDKELNKALNSLAGSLAALSSKFVEDYQPLTERLRKIVKISETINVN
ncbi:MotA/TolQ/ExbB proton channel [Desulfonema limicola]|uniref:MotA/TolQ/ExbB proton channel n=1 Tax=Desulfonema limicola TaxID=45656 RepID=A0A975B8S4_9BACT|nr:MotA/TolQ/ExbB proton channel family protein [Desulfonema limicola]QTA81079.1 MotA/TolQ/ExbB proton channel [Desulfonema limicola]